MNNVNENVQTPTNVTENNSNDPALWENIDNDFRLDILETGLHQNTNISFTYYERTYDDGINRYRKKKHFYRVLTKTEKLSNLRSFLTQDHVCDFCIMAIKKSFTKSMNFEDILDKFAVAICRKHPL